MKYILKDIKNNPIFSIFFVVNIAVGLWGISVIEIFQYNLKSELQRTAKASSGADIIISSRKFLDDGQIIANIKSHSLKIASSMKREVCMPC